MYKGSFLVGFEQPFESVKLFSLEKKTSFIKKEITLEKKTSLSKEKLENLSDGPDEIIFPIHIPLDD